jgi:hypothetical protein
MDCPYDRAAEDLGNIVALHVNLTVPDQQTATLFYVVALGLTRDPSRGVAKARESRLRI